LADTLVERFIHPRPPGIRLGTWSILVTALTGGFFMFGVGRRLLPALVSLALLLGLTGTFPAALADYVPDPTAPRSEIPEAYQWKSSHIFANLADWETEFEAVQKEIPNLAAYEGRLAESPETLFQCLEDQYSLFHRLHKLYIYAQTLYDVDQGVSENRTLQGRISMVIPTINEAIAYVEPELLKIDKSVLEGFLAEHEGLRTYDYYFEDLRRLEDHTLSQPEEKILALTSNLRGVPSDSHEALLQVDLKFPDIIDEDGQPVPLTLSGFTKYRASPVYNVRKQAAEAFFATLRAHETTLAVLLDGVAKSHILTMKSRGYNSCLEAALKPQNISTDAYRMLIDTINTQLERTLHKYITLRKKVLGLEGPVTFPNLYNPMIEDVEPEYTYEQGEEIILAALKPLGPEYGNLLAEGLDPTNGWIDVYPNQNKRSGAYSSGMLARDVHPFVLHNFDNTLDAVSTTAHEMGHALHSVYSQRNQPPVYAPYPAFLAEVASTCNEALLTDYLLEEYKNDVDMTLMLLNQRLESIRLTIFRQTLFAEFEMRFHEHAEAGNPLTAEYLNGLYKELVEKYYGPDFVMGENDECEWMFIPHFFYNFYVFTYATGLTSGLSLATQIEKQGQDSATKFINNLLKAGSSEPPLVILRNGGVDLETPQPILDMLDMFERTVADFDQIWTKAYGAS
jgi:oligoendopeptidase F